ncbi:MAG: thioredoxin family protein, partial [Candidatus Aenigmatarchaeota archaeon]
MICLIALAVFSILGIFSAKYRVYAKEAFSCVFRRITLRPCTTDFDQQMKMKVVSKMFTRSPKAAGFMYRHFETISWIFTAIMVISLAYSGMAIYSLTVYGTCDPSNPNNCVFRLGGPECAPNAQPNADIASFTDSGSAVCTEGGKPVVLMFSATWCPHCNWVSPAFEKVAKEYVDRIVARHWQLDISDDTLTSAIETGIPQAD